MGNGKPRLLPLAPWRVLSPTWTGGVVGDPPLLRDGNCWQIAQSLHAIDWNGPGGRCPQPGGRGGQPGRQPSNTLPLTGADGLGRGRLACPIHPRLQTTVSSVPCGVGEVGEARESGMPGLHATARPYAESHPLRGGWLHPLRSDPVDHPHSPCPTPPLTFPQDAQPLLLIHIDHALHEAQAPVRRSPTQVCTTLPSGCCAAMPCPSCRGSAAALPASMPPLRRCCAVMWSCPG